MQTAAGDFIKAIITISANASQNEQQCIGPNELTRQLVSQPCVEQLIGYMLGGGNPLTVGVGIIIEVIRKNNSDYDPDVGSEASPIPSSRDPIYLGTLLRRFAQNVPKFMSLIMDGPRRQGELESTFGEKLAPLGFDRFKTCELMAELLHCSNMGLLNEVGSEQLIATRDAERHRLRHEGKLGPMREEDPSTEDLTMRMSHSAPEEGRRLEVTNADDDGFEEVEPSTEMSEDTSHEFVKAEDDMAPAPPSSFLEKDEDDFVDEPLSSPRLTVTADKINEQRFDDPELTVAPLSPSKTKFMDISPPNGSQETSQQVNDHIKDLDSTAKEIDDHLKSTEHTGEIPIAPATTSGPESLSTTLSPANLRSTTRSGDLSPHSDDTPAPLFSSANDGPSSTGQTADTAQPEMADPLATEATSSQELPFKSSVNPEEAPNSTIDAELQAILPLEPVVGDYLKMQFVENRVVPAILVRNIHSQSGHGSV